jgi:hypothetical protein
MATSFRKEYEVVSRLPGQWVDGHYWPERLDTGIIRKVMMSVQNPSAGDRNAIEALPLGQRVSRYIKVYTDERLTPIGQLPGGHPGDVILADNRRYVVIGETNFNMLKQTRPNTPVSHFRYYAAEIIESEDVQTAPR